MTKKYCALNKLEMLGTCKFNCQQCTWSMSKKDLEAYVARQEAEMKRLKNMGNYKYSIKGSLGCNK